MICALQRSCSVYELLLFTYPGEFRRRFGREMVQTFSDQIWNAWENRRIRGVVHVWAMAIWELLSIALPLQMARSVVIAATLSFISSSALFLILFRVIAPHCSK